MKLNPIQKTRLAIRRAFAKDNMATIRYKKKSDNTTGSYLIDMNFIEDFGARDWDVFGRDGRLLGVVQMPARFQPRLFVGDAIYGVLRDEFDVQSIARLRVIAP